MNFNLTEVLLKLEVDDSFLSVDEELFPGIITEIVLKISIRCHNFSNEYEMI